MPSPGRSRRTTPRYSVPVVESQPITPDAPVGLTLKQVAIGIGIMLGAGGAYASIIYTQSTQGAAITDIQKKQETNSAIVVTVTKEQEAKREQLGKEFLASNREIAAKVGDLTTQLAVQQTQMKLTVDALNKISDQLSIITPPSARRR